jgi:hypothetical protein
MSALPESLVRFRTELEDAIRREQDGQATARSNGLGGRVLRAIRRRPGRTTLAVASVAGAAVAALFVGSPWNSPPGFLERAQAALTPPPGWILHMKWDAILISEDPVCTTTQRHEVWIDATPPHRYRAIVPDSSGDPDRAVADPRERFCETRPSAEVGGEMGKQPTLRFVPPNTLRIHLQPFYFDWDPTANLRAAISEGRAHREGTTQRDGRTVERIRFDPPTSCPVPPHCPTESEYGYFDPKTLDPVAYEFARDPVFPEIRHVWRYLAYEYLPRTDANLALTDIRARHPDASGP